jgi:hypothetical protein
MPWKSPWWVPRIVRRGLDAAPPVKGHRVLCDLDDPHRQGHILPSDPPGVAPAVPALVHVPECALQVGPEAEPLGQPSGDLAVGDRGRPELRHRHERLRDPPRALQGRVPLAQAAEHAGHDLGRRSEVQRHEPGPRRQLVAERLGRDLGFGGAAQEAQQGEVVDDVELGPAQVERIAETGRQHARAEGVLDRLAHAQVGGQRERRDKLGQPDSWFAALLHASVPGYASGAPHRSR